MRKYVAGVVSTLVALTGFAVYGQAPFQSLKVHIPGSVHVAQSELPAGDYTVRYLAVGGDVPYLSFEPSKGNIVGHCLPLSNPCQSSAEQFPGEKVA